MSIPVAATEKNHEYDSILCEYSSSGEPSPPGGGTGPGWLARLFRYTEVKIGSDKNGLAFYDGSPFESILIEIVLSGFRRKVVLSRGLEAELKPKCFSRHQTNSRTLKIFSFSATTGKSETKKSFFVRRRSLRWNVDESRFRADADLFVLSPATHDTDKNCWCWTKDLRNRSLFGFGVETEFIGVKFFLVRPRSRENPMINVWTDLQFHGSAF